MKHLIILPYFSKEEIKRYLKIATFLKKFSKSKGSYEFLLAASAFIRPSKSLFNAFSDIAPTKNYQCKTRISGYPEGPATMFWDIMEHINKNYKKDGGFALWLESDMLPIKYNWIELLADEWKKHPSILISGFYISPVCGEHINGGACYAKNLVGFVPLKYRKSPFDTNLFQYVKKRGRFHKSKSFAFSHMYCLLEHIQSPEKVILHGFLQDKERFISKGIQLAGNPKHREIEAKSLSKTPKRLQKCCHYGIWNGYSFKCHVHNLSLLKRLLFYSFPGLYSSIRRIKRKFRDKNAQRTKK